MKRFLLIVLLSTIYYLLSTGSVSACCNNNPSTGGCSGTCSSGTSCQYDYFQPNGGQACGGADAKTEKCYCTGEGTAPVDNTDYSTETSPLINTPNSSDLTNPGNFNSAPILSNSCSGPAKDNSSRPNECEGCKTDLLTPACATTFSANDEIKFRSSRSDFLCNSGTGDEAWLKETWGGTAQINFSQKINGKDTPVTKLPFVGKKNDPSEEKYLADYFEGTNIYRPEMDLTACQTNPTTECQEKLKNILLTAGVWQKLAPIDIQDEYKREIIKRAKNGELHDYIVETGSLSTTLTAMSGHEKPTDPAALSAWQNTDWAKLWTYVPMFSREDTEGKIMPYMGKIPSPPGDDKFEILGTAPIVEKVPHLARLYEVTKAINKLLVPTEKQNTTAKADLASPVQDWEKQNVVLGESTNECFTVTQEVVADPVAGGAMVSVTLHLYSTKDGGDGHVRVSVDGVETITNDAWNSKNGTNSYTVVPERSGGWQFVPLGGSLPQRNYSIQIDRCHGNFATQKLSLCASLDKNGKLTNSCGPLATPEPPKPPTCGLPGPASVAACTPKTVLTDTGGDGLCCSGSTLKISAMDEFTNPRYQDYQKNYGACFGTCLSDNHCAQQPSDRDVQRCEDRCDKQCDPELTHTVSRSVAVSLAHPYLDQIWLQTADAMSGFMNIFKTQTDFEDLPAATQVLYTFTPNGSSANTADPQIGDFYFPHLGGIQKAKTDILQLLNPSGGETTTYSTGFGSLGLGNNGTTPGSSSTTLDYTLPYRIASIDINEDHMNKVIIPKVKASWPKAQIDNWQSVANAAKSNGWNPAFVLSLWIEESGANGVKNADGTDKAWGLGCGVYSGVSKSIVNQLNCLFNVKYKDDSFENFMCKYSEGLNAKSPCTFTNNPNFPGGIKSWYDQLTK